MPKHNWQDAKNILAVRLDTIGDVLMTTPALRALKQSCAGRRVTLLTSPLGAQVARLVPEIDEVIEYQAPWMKATPPREHSAPELAMIERLRGRQFDGAVIFTVFSQNPLPSALLCYLADIPLRLAHCHENPYQLLTDWVPDLESAQTPVRHEVQRQLDLVATIGCSTADTRLSLRVPPAARRRAVRALDAAGITFEAPWIALHPGASAPSRRYPAESYARAARMLVEQRGLQVVVTGAESERPLVHTIQEQAGVELRSLTGELDLAELAGLIEAAPLLLTNNTGPAHIAAALGTPVVDLYALTNPQHMPWCVPQRVLCHDVPCKFCFKSVCPEGHHNCLRLIPPERVVQAVDELLGAKASYWPVPLELMPVENVVSA